MKILVLTNLYPPDVIGGYELGCKQAVDALRDLGHDVLVLTSTPRTPVPREGQVVRELYLGDIWNPYVFAHNRPITSRLIQAESAVVSAINVHALARRIEGFRPDVAYVWNLVGVGGIGLMATLQHLGVPWLWHLMDDVPLTLCRLGDRAVGPLLDELDRQLDGHYLACSRQLVDEIEAGGVGLGSDVEVVPNWVVGQGPTARTRAYRPGTGDRLRILFAGQINRNKGVDILIEAAARAVLAGNGRFRVDVYGRLEGPEFPALARQGGVEGHVRFLGPRPQSELAGLYANHDILAFPTWAREPFAFAPLEASRRGCVPLMSRRCGNAEWFVDGVHCLKADRTPDAFAAAIGAILTGSVDLAPIARQASETVGRDFHLDAILPRIEGALDVAARRSRPRRRGTAAEAYRMALLAEKLAKVMIQEAIRAA